MTVTDVPARSQAFPDPIPGIIAFGSMNLLAGASNVGKTCLLSTMLKQIRDGARVFDRETHSPTKIGYVCADRGRDTLAFWLERAGYTYLPVYSLAEDLGFDPKRLRHKIQLTKVLSDCLDKLQLPPGGLAVVDPLALFLGGNLNDYHACAVACIEIRRECVKRQITLIGVAHASKQKADKKERYQRLQDRINGSGAQLAYGDAQMYLASPEETGEKHYTFLWHSHTQPPEVFPLGRNKNGLFVPWQESQEAAQENAVYAAIPEDGTCIALATILNLSKPLSDKTVYRRLLELQTDGLIEKPQPGQYRRVKPN